MRVHRYKKGRFWAVTDEHDELVCVCVYRKGAVNVAERLRALEPCGANGKGIPAAASDRTARTTVSSGSR